MTDESRNTPEPDYFEDALSSGVTRAGEDVPFPDDQDSGPAQETEPESPPPAPDSDRDDQPAPEPDPGDTQPEPKPDYRFKDHEEAEKGYKHLQGRATRAEQRAAELQKQLEDYNNRLEAIEADRLKAQETERQKSYQRWYTERTEAAIKNIENLDPTSPTYHREVAQQWADLALDAQQKAAEVQQASAPPPTAPQPPGPPPAPEPDPTEVLQAVEAAGIDPNDPLFRSYAQMAPPDKELSDQIQWVKTKMNDYLASKTASARQRTAQPMTRSGSGKPESEPPEAAKEYSFGDVLDTAVDSRRL